MADYYFSNSTGNDANPGTIQSPKQTLAGVAGLTLNGPDRVLFKRGDTWLGTILDLVGKNIGSLTIPVTFGAYGTGENPILDFQNSAQAAGIQWNNGGAVIIEDLTIKNTLGYGIVIRSQSTFQTWGFILRRLDISNCLSAVLLHDEITTSLADGVGMEVTGCSLHDTTRDGIAVDMLVPGVMVHGNTIYNIDSSGSGNGDAITAHGQSSGHHFYNNHVYNCVDGVHFACTSSSAMKVYGNYIHDCLETCINLSRVVDLGIHEVYNNVLEVSDQTGQVGGIMIGEEFDSGLLVIGSYGTFRIYNNTIVVNKTGVPGIFWKTNEAVGANGSMTLYNNVVTGVPGAEMVTYEEAPSSGGAASWVASNNHYNEDTGNVFSWAGTASDFATWQTNSGADANSVAGTDPLLSGDVSLAATGAIPGAGSPLIGTGLNLSTSFTTDYTGEGRGLWDKGAYQYVPQSSEPTSSRSTLTRAGSQERFLASIGRVSMPAQGVQNFFFTEVGQLLRLSCDAGGVFLLTTDGSAPSADLSTEQGEAEVIYCSRGSVEIFKPYGVQTVRMMCLNNASNVVLSLFGLKPVKWCD